MEKLKFIIYNWFEFVCANRLIGVFFISIAVFICIIFAYSEKRNKIGSVLNDNLKTSNAFILFLYSSLSSALLLFPITALLLMQFQTVFYSYRALWLLAPILPITAVFLTLLAIYIKQKGSKYIFAVSILAITALLFTCGSMGAQKGKISSFPKLRYQFTYEECEPLLEKLEAISQSEAYNGQLTILAPNNITAYSHMYSGNLLTLYGKDMWDDNMKPYTYNIYPQEYHDLYIWISCAEAFGTFYNIDDQTPMYYFEIDMDEYDEAIAQGIGVGGTPYIELARENGIDVIVLYSTHPYLDNPELEHIIEKLNLEHEYVAISDTEGYTLLYLATP